MTPADLRIMFQERFRGKAPGGSLTVGRSGEEEAIQAALDNTPWEQVTPLVLKSRGVFDLSAVPFMLKPDACHYYLPAFMMACAAKPIGADLLMDTVLQCLCTPVVAEYPFFGQVVRMISGTEAAAVAAFLRFMS